MSKIIKYRAYNIKYPQTVEWEHLSQSRVYNLSKILRGEDTNMIPMQYIGMKDKNGKEIYEGDILSGKGKLDDETDKYIAYVGIVEFSEEWGRYFLKEKDKLNIGNETGHYLIPLTKDEDYFEDNQDYVEANRMEIIGNIYENADILK